MAVLASYVRFLLKFDAGSGSLSDAETGQFTEQRTISGSAPLGYYSQHIFEMQNYSGAWTTRERGMFGIHWINLTAGEVDTTWVAADFASVESAVQAFWTSDAAAISNDCRLVEHRWYAFGADVLEPNPAARVTTLATPLVGTSTGAWVRQVASTLTLRTALRKHWGRIYFPISSSMFDNNGQMTSGNVDGLAADARTMFTVTPAAQGVIPVVYDRVRKLAFGVTAIEVDSVPDIQRRRRPRDTGYKKIYTS